MKSIAISNNGNNTINTWLVNPDDYQNNPEDRYLYINLTAFPKSKSIIYVEDNSVNSSYTKFNKPISFISTSEINGEEYITTNYIEIDNKKNNSEGFGIKSVDVSLSSNFVPTVKMQFYDVKGNSFMNFDSVGSASIDNPLSVFFRQPYPVFELTIKGFYGKPVTYCLHLIKWNGKFDSQEGGFIIDAEFVGYNYSFLADIPIQYILSSSHNPQTIDKLNGTKTLYDLFSSFSLIESSKIDFEREDETFLLYKKYNTALTLLNEVYNYFPNIQFEQEFISSNLNYENLNQLDYKNYEGFVIFNGSKLKTIKNNNIILNQKIEDYNDYVTLNLNNLPLIKEKADVIFEKVNKADNLFVLLKEIVKEYKLNIDSNDIQFKHFVNPINSQNTFLENIPISYFEINKLIQEIYSIKEQLSLILTDYEKKTEIELNTKIENVLDFKPTVGNIFKIICDNTDAFLSNLHDVAVSASSLSKNTLRTSEISGNVKNSNGNIYPFPEVINNANEKSWLGDVTSNITAFPEIEYIENLMNNVVNTNSNISKLEDDLLIAENVSEGYYNHHPIFLLDFEEKIYQTKKYYNSLYDNSEVGELFTRLYLMYIQNQYLSEATLTNFAKLEAINFYNNVLNEDIRSGIFTDVTFTDNIYTQFEEGVTNPQSNVEYNNFDFRAQNPVIFQTLEPTLFNKIVGHNAKYTENYNSVYEKMQFNLKNNRKEPHLKIDKYVFSNYEIELLHEFSVDKMISIYEQKTNLEYKIDTPYLNQNPFKYLSNFLNILLPVDNDPDDEFVDFSGLSDELLLDSSYSFISDYNTYIDFFKIFVSNDNTILNNLNSLLTNQNCIIEIPTVFLIKDSNFDYGIDVFNERQREFQEKWLESNNDVMTEQYDVFYNLLKKYNWDLKGLKGNNLSQEKQKDKETFYSSLSLLHRVIVSTQQIAFVNTKNNGIQFESKVFDDDDVVTFKNILNSFKTQFNSLFTKNQKAKTNKQNNIKSLVPDTDFKLETYTNIKSLYDKWISYGTDNGKIYNACLANQYNLYDHFYFVDRTWNDISDKLIINPNTILNLMGSPNLSLYNFIAKILNDSNFMLFFAPSFVSYKSEQDVEDMFKTHFLENKADGFPSVIAMYVGGNSKFLDIEYEENENDGFSFTPQDVPKSFSTKNKVKNVVDENAYNVCAFEINLTSNDNEHFYNVEVGQEEHRNTSESLAALSEIIDKGGTNKKLFKGADLYNVYTNRSYTSSVKSLGNMQIQPMGYYQLNIPFYRGAYLITDVSHSIAPHFHETTFKGVRIPKYVYPIVEDVTAFINFDVDAIISKSQFYSQNLGRIEGSTGYDSGKCFERIPQELKDKVNENQQSGKIILELDTGTQFKLNDTLDLNTFESNLDNILVKPNLLNNYNLGSRQCMSWVKNCLSDIGVSADPYCNNNHAWTMFANIPDDENIEFFDSDTLRTNEIKDVITSKFAIIFGYYRSSASYEDAVLEIENNASTQIKTNLSDSDGNVIKTVTHVGLYYKDIFYDLIDGNVRRNEGATLKLVAYYDLYDKIVNLF